MAELFCQRSVVILSPNGLHARPAELFARLALRFKSEIEVVRNNHRVDGKSILHVLTLGAGEGVELLLEARGPDAAEAIEALANLVESDFSQDFMVVRERSS